MRLGAVAFILLLLLSAVILVQFVSSVDANFIPPFNHASSIYIRSNGSIEPSGVAIQRNGEEYAFTGDVSGGIAVQRSGVTIDGNGYRLTGSNGGTGFYLKSVSGVIIQNVNVQRFVYAVYLDNSSDSTVKANIVTGTVEVTQNSNNNRVLNNTVAGGIGVEFSSRDAIRGNTASAISIIFSNNIEVESNNFADEKRVDTRLLSVGDVGGIYIDNSDSCSMFGNTIERKTIGINIWYCTNLSFSGNTLNDNQVGFKLMGSSLERNLHNIDSTNTINGKPVYYLVNQHGFRVPQNAGWVAAVNCSGITVESLTLSANWDAVYFVNTRDSRIVNCNLTRNFNGMMLRSSSNCCISDNLIGANDYAGIYFDSTVDCFVSENDIISNYCVFGIRHGSANNLLFRNNFIDNGWMGAFDNDCRCRWDNGSQGNYWKSYDQRASYAGSDLNGDGIGDTPYVVDSYSNNTDRYPLMAPFKNPATVPQVPEFSVFQFLLLFAVVTAVVSIYGRRADRIIGDAV
jgi:parallel beta-helix repeat protein